MSDEALDKFLGEVWKGALAYTDLMTDEENAIAEKATSAGLVTARQTIVFMEDRTEYRLTEAGRAYMGLPTQTKLHRFISNFMAA